MVAFQGAEAPFGGAAPAQRRSGARNGVLRQLAAFLVPHPEWYTKEIGAAGFAALG